MQDKRYSKLEYKRKRLARQAFLLLKAETKEKWMRKRLFIVVIS